jgi:CubicO group peptidase (beta-lactamase class C family)
LTPLGIRQATWRRSPDGQATGGGGLRLRPRDAAKFGELYRAGGVWNGARIVPASWVDLSRQRTYAFRQDGYGLLWWKRAFPHAGATVECFFTSGNGGNFIFVVPSLDLVAVFTGSNYNSERGDQPLRIMADRLLPAVS